MENFEFLEYLLSGLCIAFLSSFITVKLAFVKFKSEKWWEKKAEVYTEAISALHDIKVFFEENMDACHAQEEMNSEHFNKLDTSLNLAMSNLKRITNFNIFILSKKAFSCLEKYISDMSKTKNEISLTTYLDDSLSFTYKCIAEMIKIAKKDLGVK